MKLQSVMIAILSVSIFSGCQSKPAATQTPSATRLPTTTMIKTVRPTFTRTNTPTREPSLTPTFDLTAFWTGLEPLETTGPYLVFASEYKNSILYSDLLGNGSLGIQLTDPLSFPPDTAMSPNGRWWAYSAGKMDSETGYHLLVRDIWTGEKTEIASLLPADYENRQEKMCEEIAAQFNFHYDDINPVVGWDNLRAGLMDFRWSPNGQYLAFTAIDQGNSNDIFVYDVSIGKIRKVASDIFNKHVDSWSDDSRWIIYSDTLPVGMYVNSLRAVHPDGTSGIILEGFSNYLRSGFEWLSSSQIVQVGNNSGDGGRWGGTDVMLRDVSAGTKYTIWDGGWSDYSIDPVKRTVLVSIMENIETDTGPTQTGLFLGALLGPKPRIAESDYDQSYRLAYRGGTLHEFLAIGENKILGIGYDGNTELVSPGEATPFPEALSFSPDHKWMISPAQSGGVLFNPADQIAAKLGTTRVIWKPDSSGFYYRTKNAVVFFSCADLSETKVRSIDSGFQGLSILAYIQSGHLPEKPWVDLLPGTSVNQSGAKSIWSLTPFKDLTAPGTNNYSVQVSAATKLGWEFSWCTNKPNTFADFVAPLEIHFALDDEPISTDVFQVTDSTAAGSACRIWSAVVSGFRSGDQIPLEIQYDLSASVNDGKTEYSAGQYEQIVDLTVK